MLNRVSRSRAGASFAMNSTPRTTNHLTATNGAAGTTCCAIGFRRSTVSLQPFGYMPANLTGARSTPLKPQEPSDLWRCSAIGCQAGFASTNSNRTVVLTSIAPRPDPSARPNVTISLNKFRMHEGRFQTRRASAKTFYVSFVLWVNGAFH